MTGSLAALEMATVCMALTPWKKLRDEVLAENPRWKYMKAVYIAPNGSEAEYFYLATGGAVLVIGVTDDGKIPMIRQMRPLFDKVSLEFPAGGREGGDPEAAAIREFNEEAKMSAAHIEWVGNHESCPGIVTEAMDIYVAWGLTPMESHHDEHEEFEHSFMTPAEIDDAITRREITNGMVISAWHQAKPRVLAIIDQLAGKR